MFNNYWKNIWTTLTNISVKGRSSKKEFLHFFVLRLVTIFLFQQLPFYIVVINLWVFIAEIALTIRRFHDFNKSGWFVLQFWIAGLIVCLFIITVLFMSIWFIALNRIISTILAYTLYLIMCCICIFKNGTDSPNKYGEPVIETDN